MASKTTSCKNCVVMRALDKPKACNIDCQTCSSSANRANDVGCLMLKRLDVPPRLDPYDTCDPPGGVTRSSRKEPARLIRPTPSHNAGKLPHVVVVLDAVSDSMASRCTPDLVDAFCTQRRSLSASFSI